MSLSKSNPLLLPSNKPTGDDADVEAEAGFFEGAGAGTVTAAAVCAIGVTAKKAVLPPDREGAADEEVAEKISGAGAAGFTEVATKKENNKMVEHQ